MIWRAIRLPKGLKLSALVALAVPVLVAFTAISSAAMAALAVSAFERDGGPAKVRAAAVASDLASPRASSARASASQFSSGHSLRGSAVACSRMA